MRAPSNLQSSKSSPRGRKLVRAQQRKLLLEALEGRALLATLSDAASATLTINLAANESLTVASNGGSYTLSSNQALTNGGVAQTADFSAFGGTSITLNDLAQYSTVRIIDSGANASVTFNNSSANQYSDNIEVLLDDAGANATFIGSTSLSGSNTLSIDVSRRIHVIPGASAITANGNLTLRANVQATATTGDLIAVAIEGVVQATGSGNVTIAGRGGNQGDNDYGVLVFTGGDVLGGTSGTVTVTGTGGSGSVSSNFGVFVSGAGSTIGSAGANVSVTGLGGGTGSAPNNYGVLLNSGGQITAGGAGTVTVQGTGGSTDNQSNFGVFVVNAGSAITSAGGNVTVTGQGGAGASFENAGIVVHDSAQISAGALGTVTVQGTGGIGGQGTNYGIYVLAGGTITSSGGNVSVTGTGAASTGNSDVGLLVRGGIITAGGTGTVTVQGSGGASSGSDDMGVYLDAGVITSAGGNVSVTAAAGNAVSTALVVGGGSTVSSGASAALALVADSILLSASGVVRAGATGNQTTTITPRTNGTLIDLGGVDVLSGTTLTLGLSDAELDTVAAANLQIGNVTSGAVSITGAITRPASINVSLNSGGSITFNTGSVNTGGGSLSLFGSAVLPLTAGVDVTTAPTAAVSFGAGTDLNIAVNGTTVDTQYTQLKVNGLVNLTGVDLHVSGTYTPAVGESFVIIDNDGAGITADAVIGAFNGLAALNSTVSLNGVNLTVLYNGGDGNDVVLVRLNVPPTIVDQVLPALPENSLEGAVVGTVSALDTDVGQTLTYAITSGDSEGAFEIDSSTGAITVADPAELNFEAQSTYNLTVAVTDNAVPSATSSATVTINLADANDAPVVDDEIFTIPENTVNTTVVGTVSATDEDAGQTLSYAITAGNESGAFAINTSTGAITVADASQLNFETDAMFNLTVTVTDNGTPAANSSADVTVNLTNVNEAPIVNDQTFSLAENALNGAAVATVFALDPDIGQTPLLSIIGGTGASAFSMNSAGQITVLDRTQLNFESNNSLTLVVQATDSGNASLTDTATITISLTDVNEAPVIANQTLTVAENAANGTVVGQLVAVDVDAGQTLSYAITGGNSSGAFAINANGQIVVADSTQLDLETQPTFNLTVAVTDNGATPLTSSAAVTINVVGVNEAPVIANQSFTINSKAVNGAIVGQVVASDPEGQPLTYSLTGNAAFAIDPTTGQIRIVNAKLLPKLGPGQSPTTVTLQVTATDPSNLSSTANVNVTLAANATMQPVVTNKVFSILENNRSGAIVGHVGATPAYAGQQFTYSLTGADAANFRIDSRGVITVKPGVVLDFEADPSYSFQVVVADKRNPSATTTANVTVNILNVNEAAQIILSDANGQPVSFLNVPEGTANGTVVGRIDLIDPDTGLANTQTTVFFLDTSRALAFNRTTGEITVANSSLLDYERNRNGLTVRVFSLESGQLPQYLTFQVRLSNVNEAPTGLALVPFILPGGSNPVAAGTTIGKLRGFDPDASQTFTYSLVAGTGDTDNAKFTISGDSLVASSPLNRNVTHKIRVRVTDQGGLWFEQQLNVRT